ncbi:MAG: ACT domain-containing protein [Tissierellia bacterium]|nr:ACT domain-containing protein [Tissierellia bacterium]
MRAVITIIGYDKVGIVYKVSELLVKYNLNIVDINQTIIDQYFTMIMIVDITSLKEQFTEVVDAIDKLAEELNMDIRIQREDIFNSMYQV